MCTVDTEDLFLVLQTIAVCVCLSVCLSILFAWSIWLNLHEVSTEYKGQGSKKKKKGISAGRRLSEVRNSMSCHGDQGSSGANLRAQRHVVRWDARWANAERQALLHGPGKLRPSP